VSLEILLIPLAFAAVNAWQARAHPDQERCMVETRLRSPELLTKAITALGGTCQPDATGIRAQLGEASLQFSTNADGLAVAHVEGVELEEAQRIISDIDREYASAVQTQMYDTLLARAETLGLSVESESVDAENTITVVLNVGERAAS